MAINLRIGDSKVVESRESQDGAMIRRRRVSLNGKHRFTTYERIERPSIMVEKSSGNREAYDREKLFQAVQRSVGKFFKNELEIEDVVNSAENIIYELGAETVRSKAIGEAILEVLAERNEVAYVRFASVFREFKSLDEFEKIIGEQKCKNLRKSGGKGDC